ncbi:MAG: zinc-dependent metalloprotease family protein [bacterium]|nr:zinc-dependent metalloprotease family protein [bacterium]
MKQTAFIARLRSVRLLLALLIGAGVLSFSLSRPVMAESAARDRAQAQQPAPAPDTAPNDLFGTSNLSADVAAAMSDVALNMTLNPLRYRTVSLNDAMLATSAADFAAGRSSSAESFRLNLFADVVYTAVNTKITPRYMSNPGYIWYGQIPELEISDVVFVVTPDFIEGRIWTPGRNYLITLSGSLYTIIEMNPEDASQRAPAALELPPQYQVNVSPKGGQTADNSAAAVPVSAPSAQTVMAGDGPVIDVLVTYTTASMNGQNLSQFTAAVEAEVAISNSAITNSQANFQINIVALVPTSYTEVGFETDLNRITSTNDGFMDDIHATRNQYGADLVALLRGNGEYCGIAWLMTNVSTNFASNGFSVTGRTCFGNFSFIHEIAHNMGSQHDPLNGSGGAYSYSYGYQDTTGAFRTIMAYANQCPGPGSCPRVGRFSNPNLSYNERVTGTATQNNALSLSNTAPTVAQFRASVSAPPSNDNFANALVVDAFTYVSNVTTTNATNEANDPTLSCAANVGKTIWYRFTATGSGTVNLSTAGSNFDTAIAAYTGSPGAFTQVGCNDNGSGQGVFDLTVTAGTTYYVLIGGKGQTGGAATFTFSAPWEDDFNYAVGINALPYTYNGSTAAATTAGDDPNLTCISGEGKSIWLRYTAPASGTVTLTTNGSNFDTVLGVFTGSRGSLTQQACNDDATGTTSAINNFAVTSGTTYHIYLGGYNSASGTVVFNMTGTVAAPTPVVSAPTGTITNAYGNPSYVWNDTGASSYELAVWLLTPSVATSLAPNSVIYYGQNLADGTYCDGTTCTINPVSLTESARLVNGTYAAYVRATGGAWQTNPTNFTLSAPALAPITSSGPSSTTNPVTVSSLTPAFNWNLNGTAANTTWFNLYIAPKAQFDAGNYTPTFNQWQSRADRCGSTIGTSCSFTAPTLVENTIYYFFVQSYGPSGYSTGGQYTNGWEGGAFLVDSIPNPALPTTLATNINSGHPSLGWVSPAEATSHTIAIYNWTTNAWVYSGTHAKTGDPSLICSAGTCVFKNDAFVMTNGAYSFYVNSINANGTSLLGPFSNGYAGPTNPGSNGEAGDFSINVAAPSLPASVNGSISSGNIIGSWQTPNHTTYYNVWVGTAGAAQTYVFQTLSTLDLGCENPTQTCSFSIPLAGLGIPAGTQLYMAVQAVGPGGYATTGGEASNGYRVSAAFNAP